MTIRFPIPLTICVHDRDAWKHLAEHEGIDFDKKTWAYRDLHTGQYVIGQETDASGDMDNGR